MRRSCLAQAVRPGQAPGRTSKETHELSLSRRRAVDTDERGRFRILAPAKGKVLLGALVDGTRVYGTTEDGDTVDWQREMSADNDVVGEALLLPIMQGLLH